MAKEIRVTDPKTGGQKGTKPQRYDLIPWESVATIACAYHYGASKYEDPDVGPHNWRRGYKWSLSYAALMRHLTAWWDGEDTDPESGLSHLAHAGWHVLTLIWYTIHQPGMDDRPHTYFRKAS